MPHVIVGVWQGIVDEVRLTKDEEKAKEIEQKICKEFEVSFEEKEREEYYEKNAEPNEVYHFTVREDFTVEEE
ncbi:hypothetical protein AKJ35_01025 [candidate division MSBL1 archaeon SCGC-AAA833F18]|uniref:Uncharacterized protein n=1 Tax=candidate division MSBL1 archaeon SCGC-AAA833F18 TaxID=1698257 RepID=A0A133VS98_9EURY|nr:hypothetical protein AKJ35_01025 [candidate division MSBL1 archaeon SCGC-AAA833F18]